MKTIKLLDYFNEFCSNGDEATKFLKDIVIPEIEDNDKICFDFNGIRNMNSSFSNALFANLIRKLKKDVLKKITFANCEKNIQMFISSSISMGLEDLEIKDNS